MDIKLRDSNGALLAEGDAVTLRKGLKLKGSSTVLNRGTAIKNIHLTENEDEIEGRTDKVKGLVLRTEFLEGVKVAGLDAAECNQRVLRAPSTPRALAPRGRSRIESISTSLRAQRSNPFLLTFFAPRDGLLRCARNDGGARCARGPSVRWAIERGFP